MRDYLHVVDLADAHLLALGQIRSGEHQVINLGSGTGYTVREVLDAVRRVTGHPVPTVDGPRRAGDPPTLIASNARAADVLGWAPTRGIEQMAGDAWAYVQGLAAERV